LDSNSRVVEQTGESLSTKRGFCQKYKIEQNSALAMNDEVPSGIICDAMDILYILEMNLAFCVVHKG